MMTDLSLNGRPRRNLEAFSSTAQIEAADRLAETLIVAFGQCEQAGRPLTELQKTDLLSVALAAFDGYRAELESRLAFERTLVELRRSGDEANGPRSSRWR